MEIVTYLEVAQSCLTLYDPMGCSLQGSSVLGILQESILELVAIPFSRGSSQPRYWTQVSCIGRQILYQRAQGKAHKAIIKGQKVGGGPIPGNLCPFLKKKKKKKKERNKLTLTPNFKTLSLCLSQALSYLLKWPHALFVECAALSINSLLTHHSCSLYIFSWWSKKLKFTSNKSNNKEIILYIYMYNIYIVNINVNKGSIRRDRKNVVACYSLKHHLLILLLTFQKKISNCKVKNK